MNAMYRQFLTALETLRLKPSRTQLLRFGLSLVLGILLWGWVTQLQDPYTERNFDDIPVSAGDLSGDLQVVTSVPNASVTIGGSNSRVDPVRRQDITIQLDTRGITSPGMHRVALIAETADVSSVSVEPQEVTIQVDERVSEVFPLTVINDDSSGEARSIGQVQPTVTQVTVTGPRSAVQRVNRVVLPVSIGQNVQDFSEEFEPYVVDTADQVIAEVMVNPATVVTRVNVETRGKEVSVIPSVTGLPAEGFAVQQRRVFPDTIIVDGPVDVLNDLLFINTRPVDISDARQSVSASVELSDLPDGVTIVEPANGTVEVRIAIEDTTASSQALNDLPLEFVGIGPGLAATTNPEVISIQVTAPASVLQAMTPEDISVFIDVAGLEPGSYMLEPEVTVPQGTTWIGSDPGVIEVTIVPSGVSSPAPALSSPEAG